MDPGRSDAVRGAVTVEEDNPRHRGRIGQGEVADDRRAAGMPDEHGRDTVGSLEPQCPEKSGELCGVRAERVRPSSLGVSVAADVQRIDPVSRSSQNRPEPVEDVGRFREARDEHDRRPGPSPRLVMRPDVGGLDPVAVRIQRRDG